MCQLAHTAYPGSGSDGLRNGLAFAVTRGQRAPSRLAGRVTLEGNHPRLRLYFQSPAAQALVSAERAFPIMRTAADMDLRPLMHPVDIGVTLTSPGGNRLPGKAAGAIGIAASVLAGALLIRRKGASL